ncbi:MAG: hypothetical protein KGH67_02240, partial [Candidatus Micrarchaeota archaeon]|nr:hypothetical protein [Candidatus Micrarchaeota archaeon]
RLGPEPYIANLTDVAARHGHVKMQRQNSPGTVGGRTMKMDGGLLFAFSNEPFDLTYGSDNGEKGEMQGITAAIIPAGITYKITHNGSLHIASSNLGMQSESPISKPVGYTMSYIKTHLNSAKANKLAIPLLMNGEVVTTGAERVDGNEKHVVIGPKNQELSAANSMSPQDYHVHMRLTETYTTFSGMTLEYTIGKTKQRIEVGVGETIIVPAVVVHKVELHGIEPTFVTMSSRTGIREDKFIIPEMENPNLNGNLIIALRP